MWTAATRAQHRRDGPRFASDLTDREREVIEPLLPGPSPVGRPPAWPLREIVDAIFYMLRGGIPWLLLRHAVHPGSPSMAGSRHGAMRWYGSRSPITW